VPLLCSGQSDRGLVRKTNQDSILIHTEQKCFVIADGMGGHRGGDIASQLTVQVFAQELTHAKGLSKVDIIKRAVEFSNKLIYEKSQSEDYLNGMGTTVVSLIIDKSKAFIANVGDSRVYLMNNNLIYQITRDHSLVQEKLNLGIYTREEAAQDKMKNILVRTLGFEDKLEFDLFEYTISKNDLFMICSDGLYGKVCDEEIAEIINKNIPKPEVATSSDLDKAVEELIQRAKYYGGNDNISVIIALAQTPQ
jgi:protein phosphatase